MLDTRCSYFVEREAYLVLCKLSLKEIAVLESVRQELFIHKTGATFIVDNYGEI